MARGLGRRGGRRGGRCGEQRATSRPQAVTRASRQCEGSRRFFAVRQTPPCAAWFPARSRQSVSAPMDRQNTASAMMRVP